MPRGILYRVLFILALTVRRAPSAISTLLYRSMSVVPRWPIANE